MLIDSTQMRHCALEHSIKRRGGKEELIHRGHAAPKDFAGFTRLSLVSIVSQREIPEEGNKPIGQSNHLANNSIVQRMKNEKSGIKQASDGLMQLHLSPHSPAKPSGEVRLSSFARVSPHHCNTSREQFSWYLRTSVLWHTLDDIQNHEWQCKRIDQSTTGMAKSCSATCCADQSCCSQRFV